MAGTLLTPAQYAKTAPGKAGKPYGDYASFVRNTRTRRETTRRANQITSFSQNAPQRSIPAAQQFGANVLYPFDPQMNPWNTAHINSAARGMVQPGFLAQMNLITDAANTRGRLGSNAIGGYTQNYLSQLKPIQDQVSNIYDQAQNQQSNVTASLANFIRDQGGSLQSQMQGMESGAGQTSAGSDQMATLASGASGAAAMYGGSGLSNLIAQGAAEKAYAAQLPAWGRSQGLQTLGNFASQVEGDRASAVKGLSAQLPAALNDAYQTVQGREMQKMQMRGSRDTGIANYVSGVEEQNAAVRAAYAGIMGNVQSGVDSVNSDQARIDASGIKPPKEGTLASRMQNQASGLTDRASNLHSPALGKGKTWGQVRKAITASAKLSFPELGPVALKNYVDQILYGALWPGPKKPGEKTVLGPPQSEWGTNTAQESGGQWWNPFPIEFGTTPLYGAITDANKGAQSWMDKNFNWQAPTIPGIDSTKLPSWLTWPN